MNVAGKGPNDTTGRTSHQDALAKLVTTLAFVSLILSGAIFGFFYAWICSTMWGLDATDPRTAIAAMQAMNASVGNAVFAPAFFGSPFVLAATAVTAYLSGRHRVVLPFSAGALIYLLGGMILTMSVNVPMNMELADVIIPEDISQAQAIWDAYSPRWQVFNTIRTFFSGITLGLVGIGLTRL